MGKKAKAKKDKQNEEIKKAEAITGGKVDKIEEARKAIEEDKKKRAEDFRKELEVMAKKYNCEIAPNVNIVINGQQVGLAILPK